jgi:molybdopterin converting factor small subunit
MNNITMEITLKLFASLSDYLPKGSDKQVARFEIIEGETAYSVLDRCNVPRDAVHLVLLNGIYMQPDERDQSALKEGDTLAVWPAVAGG